MAKTSSPRQDGRDDGGVKPIVIVAGVAVVAFVVAFLAFRGGSKSSTVTAGTQTASTATGSTTASGGGCSTGTPDTTYTVNMDSNPNPPKAEGTTFHLTVRHNGTAVTRAQVCMTADMTEMHHGGINNVAKESSGGRYDTELKFGMRGPYAASVVITEPGKQPVSVPITFQVT